MRKTVQDLVVTLDGLIEVSNGEKEWYLMDDDMDFDSFVVGSNADLRLNFSA